MYGGVFWGVILTQVFCLWFFNSTFVSSNKTCICLLRRLFFEIFLFMVFQVGLFAFPLFTSPVPYPSSSHPPSLPSPTPTSHSDVTSTIKLLPPPPLSQPLLPFPYLLADFSSPLQQPRNNPMQVVYTFIKRTKNYRKAQIIAK